MEQPTMFSLVVVMPEVGFCKSHRYVMPLSMDPSILFLSGCECKSAMDAREAGHACCTTPQRLTCMILTVSVGRCLRMHYARTLHIPTYADSCPPSKPLALGFAAGSQGLQTPTAGRRCLWRSAQECPPGYDDR